MERLSFVSKPTDEKNSTAVKASNYNFIQG
jgi:hypothetical protein